MRVFFQSLCGRVELRRILQADRWTLEAGRDDTVLAEHPGVADKAAARRRLHQLGLMRRILMVSDNHVLGLTLSLLGHHVQMRPDGQGAVVVAKSYRPHLVLIDVAQAWVDGYQLARCLRQQLGREVCLVALSDNAQEDRRYALRAGFDALLVSPVAAEKVLPLLEDSPNREAAPWLKGWRAATKAKARSVRGSMRRESIQGHVRQV
jgi:CheY-like chemotaxis protein